jgi:hypothetical protein
MREYKVSDRRGFILGPRPWAMKTRNLARPDDYDFRLHLSNSSYAKVRLSNSVHICISNSSFLNFLWAQVLDEVPINMSYDYLFTKFELGRSLNH